MKKIISGRIYDTDTATNLGTWWSSSDVRDFSHVEEKLFRKRTGEYFLYGCGGPMSKYARAEGQNSWTGGERIMPMSWDEARAWAEEHLDAEEYIAAFGPVSEEDGDVMLSIRVPASLAETLRRTAAKRNVTQQALLIELLRTLSADKGGE